jgi:hypothetical protein
MRQTLLVASIGFLAACNSGGATGSGPGNAGGSASTANAASASAIAPSASAGAAANSGAANAASPASPTGGALHLGEPITASKVVTLSEIVKHPKQFEGNVVTTSGTVFAVCQSMGCWMEIKDDASTEAHVKLAGHKFFVPKTSAGHHARVQAKVMRTDPSEECAQEAEEQTGKPVAKLELEATGVELE